MDPVLTKYYEMYFAAMRLRESMQKQADFDSENSQKLHELRVSNLWERIKLLEDFITEYTKVLKNGIK